MCYRPKLIEFRQNLYNNYIPYRRDAVFNLLDSLSSYAHRCKSVVELCEATCFTREYPSVTDAITTGLESIDSGNISQEIFRAVDESHDRVITALDCTPEVRKNAKCLEDSHIVYAPNPAPGNKPIERGHHYSAISFMPQDPETKAEHWAVPMSIERCPSNQKSHEMGMKQLRDLIKMLSLKDRLIINVADSSYATMICRQIALESANLVHISRLNSTRNVFAQVDDESQSSGRNKRYGNKMQLNDESSHLPHETSITKTIKTASGKIRHLKIKTWNDMLLRGSRDFKSYEHPITLIQVIIADEAEKTVNKKPLWLALTGTRQQEVTSEEAYEYYASRFDIEHFFRFGKTKLLMDGYQTPETDHEEYWWRFIPLAYTQLYLARKLSSLLPKRWERYLKSYKKGERKSFVASPSQVQRYFSVILADIGTPAGLPKQRGNPQGRSVGETQKRRPNYKLVYKTSKRKELDQSNICESEKTRKNSACPKMDVLAKSVLTQLKNVGENPSRFYQRLQNGQ